MALSTSITNASEIIARSLNEGVGSARSSLGGGGTAFGWTAGLPRTLANFVSVLPADGMSVKATIVSQSPTTPAAIVAEGTAKPDAAVITRDEIQLVKFAGLATATLESHLDAAGVAAAISQVLSASCLMAYESHAIGVLAAAGGIAITAPTDWVSAVASAQAAILGNGGTPGVLVISALDYGAFIADVLATAAFSQSPDSPVGSILGSVIHVSPKAAAGKAYLLDPNAVFAVEHRDSPVGIADSTSLAHENKTRYIVDLVASTFVSSSLHLAEITAPVTGTTRTSPFKTRQ